MRILLAALSLVACAAQAQDDVALVNLVSGDVKYTPAGGAAAKVSAFMKVLDGDRFDLAAGSQLRVVYLRGSRQETWQGPASFRAAAGQGEPIRGKPAEVKQLPPAISGPIARVPQLMQNAKLGGVQLRGLRPDRTAADEEKLRNARATYEKLRGELPRDDITAELYYYAALEEYKLYEEMRPIAREMVRKQPNSEEARLLLGYVNGRSKH